MRFWPFRNREETLRNAGLKAQKQEIARSVSVNSSFKQITEMILEIKRINEELGIKNSRDIEYDKLKIMFGTKSTNALRAIIIYVIGERYSPALSYAIATLRDLKTFSEVLEDDRFLYSNVTLIERMESILSQQPKQYIPKNEENLIYFFAEYFRVEIEIVREVVQTRIGIEFEEFASISLDYLKWKNTLLEELLKIVEQRFRSDRKLSFSTIKEKKITNENLIKIKEAYENYKVSLRERIRRVIAILGPHYAIHVPRGGIQDSMGILKKGLRCTGGQSGANFLINYVHGGPPDSGIFIFRCRDIIKESILYKRTYITVHVDAKLAVSILEGKHLYIDPKVDLNSAILSGQHIQLNIETPSFSLRYLKSPVVCVVNDYQEYVDELTKRGMKYRIKNLQDKNGFEFASQMANYLVQQGRADLERKFASISA